MDAKYKGCLAEFERRGSLLSKTKRSESVLPAGTSLLFYVDLSTGSCLEI
jgi:hypothetical protein